MSRISTSPQVDTDSNIDSSEDESDMDTFRRVNKNAKNNGDNDDESSNLKLSYKPSPTTNLEVSREIVLTLKAYLDEAERDLFSKKWDNVLVYLGTYYIHTSGFI